MDEIEKFLIEDISTPSNNLSNFISSISLKHISTVLQFIFKLDDEWFKNYNKEITNNEYIEIFTNIRKKKYLQIFH